MAVAEELPTIAAQHRQRRLRDRGGPLHTELPAAEDRQDAPEQGLEWDVCRAALERSVPGSVAQAISDAENSVQLAKDVSNTDRFGRLLRSLWTGEGLFNEQIVRDGFATLATFPPDVKYVERIRAAQQEAYDAGRGLWADDACVEVPALPTQPMPTATSPVGQMTWYTSSHSSAQYYYCELDPQWKSLSPAYLRSYPSEVALLAEWGKTRVKYHSSKC